MYKYPKSPSIEVQAHQPGIQSQMHPQPEVIKPNHQGSNKLKDKIALITGGDSGAVAPGPIWTPLIPSSFDEEQLKDFGKKTPMGRMGQPSEVAPAYLFLASDEASYISGQVIHVNGGTIING
ncbi:SDR family oxidoreductase [Acinetobacter sp. SM34]|uniref:SDR family oxidoreductase n=1 Tax=Acinetobacter sp. SM34 TaxID=1301620 RepID=UPI001EDA611C|nr:SDR family oxidoreductase [Acinetobacter sp. SM34]MCG2609768.1 SDR family oxidoreductase [Acinetobacter sp. SM34]